MGAKSSQGRGQQGLAAKAVPQSQPGAGQWKPQCSPRPEHWVTSWGQAEARVGQAGLRVPWHTLSALERQIHVSHVALWQQKGTERTLHMPWRQYLRYQAMKPHGKYSINPSCGLAVAHIMCICLVWTESVPSAALSSSNSPIFRLLHWSFQKMRVLPSWAATVRTWAAAFWSCRQYLSVV